MGADHRHAGERLHDQLLDGRRHVAGGSGRESFWCSGKANGGSKFERNTEYGIGTTGVLLGHVQQTSMKQIEVVVHFRTDSSGANSISQEVRLEY